MRRWLASILTLTLLSSAPVFAQTAAPAFTSTQTRAVDRIVQDEIDAHSTPGLAIGIVEDGRLVYAHGFGYADLAKKARAGALTQFYGAALSMQFTAASVLLLAQDKKLSLDDRVTKYVPELKVAGTATIRQLLQQTSGLPDYSKVPGFNDRTRPIKLDDLLKAADRLQPPFEPGTKFAYNDLNYLVAGLIVARVSGVPYSVYLQTKIFEPLLMTSSFVAGDQGVSPAHAIGYTRISDRFTPAKLWDPSWLFGANGVVSDIFDLAKWDIGLPLLLNVDSVSAMWTPGGAPGSMAYGMGWVVDQRGGHRYIWTNGEISGYHAMNALLPDDHVGVIVLTNVDRRNSQDTISPEEVANKILDAIAPLPPARVDNVIIDRAKEWIDRLARVDVDRTQLTANFNEYLTDDLVSKSNFKALGKVVSLTPVASYQDAGDNVYVFLTQFEHGTYDYQFRLTPQGKIDGLVLKPPSR